MGQALYLWCEGETKEGLPVASREERGGKSRGQTVLTFPSLGAQPGELSKCSWKVLASQLCSGQVGKPGRAVGMGDGEGERVPWGPTHRQGLP